jgi:hypothetical protein
LASADIVFEPSLNVTLASKVFSEREAAAPFTATIAVESLTVPVTVREIVLTIVPSVGEVIFTVRGRGALLNLT